MNYGEKKKKKESRRSKEKEKGSFFLNRILIFSNSVYRYVEQYIFCEPIANLGTVPQFRRLLEEMDPGQNR